MKNQNYTITINFEHINFNRVSWFISDFADEENPEENLKEFFEGEILDALNRFLVEDKYVDIYQELHKRGGAYLAD